MSINQKLPKNKALNRERTHPKTTQTTYLPASDILDLKQMNP